MSNITANTLSKEVKNTTRGWGLEACICFPFFSLQFTQQIPTLATLLLILKGFICLLVGGLVVIKGEKLSPVTKIILFLSIIVCVTTLFNGDNLHLALQRYYPIVGIALFIELRKRNITRLYVGIFHAAEILIYINLITMLLYPEGIYIGESNNVPYWIIGQKQDFVSVFLIETLLVLILRKRNSLLFSRILVSMAMVASLSIILSLGLTFCLAIPLFMFLFKKIFHTNFKSIFLFKVYLVLQSIVIYISFVFEKLQLLIFALESISTSDDKPEYTKADTFYERIMMWSDATKLILKNPLGNGCISEERFDRIMKTSNYHPHIHNTFWDIMLSGGIFAIIAFVILNVIVSRSLDKVSGIDRDAYTYILFASTILMLTECLYWPFVFAIYLFAYYYSNTLMTTKKCY